MAINFPSTAGQPTDGTFTHTEGSVTWVWNGTAWGRPTLQDSNFQNGTESAPSITFASDTNTGLFANGSDEVAITTGGTEALRVTGNQNVLIGHNLEGFYSSDLQVFSNNDGITTYRFNSGAGSEANITLARSRSSVIGDNVALQSGDEIGSIFFSAATGTNYLRAADITGVVDAEPNTSGDTTDMPGRLEFRTCSDGSSTIETRMIINSAGDVGINQNSPTKRLHVVDVRSSTYEIVSKFAGGNGTDAIAGISLVSGYSDTANDHEGHVTLTSSREGNGNRSAFTVITADDASTSTEKFRVSGAGNVLIGAPSTYTFQKRLNIQGSSGALISLYNGDTTTYATDTHSSIEFRILTGNTGNTLGTAEIRAEKENGTNGDNSTNLSFYTRSNGSSSAKRMTIRWDGHVGIGTDNPANMLEVSTDAGRVMQLDSSVFRINQTASNWTSRSYTENPIIMWDYASGFGDHLYFMSGGNTANSDAMGMVISDGRGVVMGEPTYNGSDSGIDMTDARNFFRVHTNGKVYAGGGVNVATGGWGSNYAGHSGYGFIGGGETDGVLYRAAGQAYLAADDFFRIRDNINNNENKRFEFNTDNGNAGADASWNSNNFDFAEMFEWSDGNPEAEDRIGYSVCIDPLTGKIRKAEEGDTPFGVVSGTASFVANAGEHKWAGYWKRDEWGRQIKELAYNGEGDPLLDDEGNHRYKTAVNPEWDESLVYDYVPRDERPEWACIGVLGQVYMRKGCPVDSRWVKLKEIDSVKDLWLVR